MTGRNNSGKSVTKDPGKVWSDFLSWIRSRPTEQFVFRGQGKDHPIIPKIGRDTYPYSAASEQDLLAKFKRTALAFHTGRAPQSDWEWLALAQHHGAPTRFADWSENPLVALYFAVNDCDKNSDAFVYALDVFTDEIGKVLNASTGETDDGTTIKNPLDLKKRCYLLETASVSARIIPQRGVFTVHGEPKKPLVVPANDTFRVDGSLKREMMTQLMQFGVEAVDIFPDIDGLCKTITARYAHGIALGVL